MLTLSGIFLLVVILSGAVAGFGTEWCADRNRAFLFWFLLGVIVIWALPNWWLKGLLAVIVGRLIFGPAQLETVKKIDDIILVAAVAALLMSLVDVSVVPAVLWGIVLAGLWTVVYSLVSLHYFDKMKGYALSVPVTPYYHLRFYEYQSAIAAGQGNPNHLHGLATTAMAASLGLGVTGQTVGYWLAPLCTIPICIAQFVRTDNPGHWKRPQQGWAHLLVLGLAWLPLWLGPVGWLGLVALTGVVVVTLWRNRHTDTGIDSGRGMMWFKMVKEWWHTGWGNRVLGWGAKTFETHYVQFAQSRIEQTGQMIIAHHPHSEYVCCLVENGIVGMACLTGYLLSTLVLLMDAGPHGLALYLVGVTLCSAAFVSFPFTFYHELLFRIQPPTNSAVQPQARLFTLGTPALFVISFAVCVTAESILHGSH